MTRREDEANSDRDVGTAASALRVIVNTNVIQEFTSVH